ncbi:hypothetical protein THAOC_15826 [Thalassiosira oceanica]|uniref:Uncharacterized protein n=1 Tax=Thalassiosira oceanica TaxID=159749 RepID=K0SR23_THAOC|nr:hypothetical protein THAOC_15826 [Thalassiosira oceanica]|eukprot:EJK63511.1 hypothetical protein THAOC_15826 [Thalassiosira oceanica]
MSNGAYLPRRASVLLQGSHDCRMRPRPWSIQARSRQRALSLATSPASKLLVRSRSRPPAAFECPARFLTTSRPILEPSIASYECPFTGGFVSRVVRPSKADALEMKPSSQPAERPPASRIVSDRLGDLDHWSTTDRHVLSYTPALDARLPAYPLPHRPVPPARSPLSGIERADAMAGPLEILYLRTDLVYVPLCTLTHSPTGYAAVSLRSINPKMSSQLRRERQLDGNGVPHDGTRPGAVTPRARLVLADVGLLQSNGSKSHGPTGPSSHLVSRYLALAAATSLGPTPSGLPVFLPRASRLVSRIGRHRSRLVRRGDVVTLAFRVVNA